MRCKPLAWAALVLLVAAAWAHGAAAEPAPPEVEAAESGLIQLNFPENLEVKALIDYVATRLGMNILYDEAAVRKRVTIVAPAKVPRDSLLGLLQSVLKMTGLAMVDADQAGWKKIVATQNLLSVTGSVERDTERMASAESTTPITQVFGLRYATTAFIEQVIKPFLSTPGGNSFSVADQDLLIVTDYADNLRRVAELIELFDRPRPEASIRFVEVEHWDAGELAKQVTSLLRERERVVGAERTLRPRVTLTHDARTNRVVAICTEGAEAEALELIEALDVPTTAETRTYRFANVSPGRIDKLARDFAGEDVRTRYKSTVDEEAGLLIVTAPPHIHKHIADLAGELDVAISEEQNPVRFYKILNTTAAEVLATIRALESGEGGLAAIVPAGLTGASAKSEEPSFTGPNLPPPPLGEELPKPPAFRPSEEENEENKENKEAPSPQAESRAGPQATRTGQAIVTADPNTNTLIVVAPPAVQRVYEQLIKMLDKRRPQVMIEVTVVTLDTSDNFSLGIEISGANIREDFSWLTFSAFGLSTVDLTTGSLALTPGTGFNGVIVDPHVVDVVIRALASSGRAEVVSAPKILVNDNATGTLQSIAESPFTSVNASDTVATTSFAGYAQAGTAVTLSPHISEGDHLQLNYTVTLNSFTGVGAGGVPPPRQTDTISSEVTVPDGHAIIVGGLRRQDTSETASKVPLLGDIPLLGHLFSTRTESTAETTLFVFIRPVILRDDRFEDLKYLSQRDLELAGLPPNLPRSGPLFMR